VEVDPPPKSALLKEMVDVMLIDLDRTFQGAGREVRESTDQVAVKLLQAGNEVRRLTNNVSDKWELWSERNPNFERSLAIGLIALALVGMTTVYLASSGRVTEFISCGPGGYLDCGNWLPIK
jgi:hypothetical protein